MNKFITMLKLMYTSIKTHKRIMKLIKIQSKLLEEMNTQLKSYEKDKDLYIGTHLFDSTNLITQYIETLEKNIEIMETKMKDLLKD
ncbi:hypothetical protein [Clostridium beijerinckii]|uniref:hypothetical protein n=1 Tax=Clostridium beijerinckii TaxID=1520 RepID=UPI00156FDD7E|nr:hypothetical protein [Clostridium beijerinckii]NRU52616.1 hypothetical protein [Clostridium beijerinckii]NYC68659.1 hypothetical protein [Clostridium beijerinckii]NYC91808.1 hypothetical protein [Clostridium beijerinckii]